MKGRRPNIGASVRAKLLEGARERGDDFSLVLQRYAAERFLYRLGASPHRSEFVLKGAMLFALWGGSLYRATRDLDFTGYGSSDPALFTGTIKEICAISSSEDGIEFLPNTVEAERIRDDSEYGGYRVHVESRLDTARIRLQIDIGFGNAIVPAPREEDYPVLIDVPRPRILAYPREAVVAEKLHAMVVLGAANSRMNDLYDLFVLSTRFRFDGTLLARAIGETFKRRATEIAPEQPVSLTPDFFADPTRAMRWRGYLERNTLPGAPRDLDVVGERLRAFLSAPLTATGKNAAFRADWPPGGPWS